MDDDPHASSNLAYRLTGFYDNLRQNIQQQNDKSANKSPLPPKSTYKICANASNNLQQQISN